MSTETTLRKGSDAGLAGYDNNDICQVRFDEVSKHYACARLGQPYVSGTPVELIDISAGDNRLTHAHPHTHRHTDKQHDKHLLSSVTKQPVVQSAGTVYLRITRPTSSCHNIIRRYSLIFTARCYASAVLAMGLCPSVRIRCFIETAERIELVFLIVSLSKPPRRFAASRIDADDILGRPLWVT